MKVYLVGGAVRDKQLGLPVKEKDWVVVGAKPEQLTSKGYKKVGKDFPVFLHPDTGEEYALARTERKKGHGYYGFLCDYNPNVSLEEDLGRRDITINAMAMDEQGHIYDPYGGQADLQARVIRHVSSAFVEDPVRVLRVARFMARFKYLGFKLADETRALMYQMVKNQELEHLVPERAWQEWQRSLTERNPECFITTLRACGALKAILPELDVLFGIPNPPTHHPEIDSGVHSLNVLQACCGLTDNPIVRFAAFLHDLGKGVTPQNEWPAHHGHEIAGVQLIGSLCQRFRTPTSYRNLAKLVCRYHLNIHLFQELKASTVVSVLEKTDAFRKPEQFKNLLMACLADSLGKGVPDIGDSTIHQWEQAFNACLSISAKMLVEEGFEGEKIKTELHKRRVNRVQSIFSKHK